MKAITSLSRSNWKTRNIKSIDVGKLEVSKDEEIDIDSEGRKKYSREVYFRSIGLAKEVVESIHQQKPLPIRKAKRLMQKAANAVMQDDSTLLGLANIKNYDESTFNHSVNVAIYAMALGQRIGIPKKHLSHLGMAGLFHDIGKTKIPEEILNKTEGLSPEERSIMRSHPVIGAELIMRMKEWGELSARMTEGAFEHHLRYDLTGYPRLAQKKKMTLFGRIVSIADFYDALARPRVSPRFPYVSEKILEIMLERSGKDFDPGIVKVFINMIGAFPLGTLALLNTHEMGIVTQIQEDTELLDRPKVCLIYYSDGEYRKGKVVDLGEMDEVSGDFKKSIVKTLDPNEYNINVAEFFSNKSGTQNSRNSECFDSISQLQVPGSLSFSFLTLLSILNFSVSSFSIPPIVGPFRPGQTDGEIFLPCGGMPQCSEIEIQICLMFFSMPPRDGGGETAKRLPRQKRDPRFLHKSFSCPEEQGLL